MRRGKEGKREREREGRKAREGGRLMKVAAAKFDGWVASDRT